MHTDNLMHFVRLLQYSLEIFGLIGMQLPEKYKENFDVSSEYPLSGS
jgi:hypothetical protein